MSYIGFFICFLESADAAIAGVSMPIASQRGHKVIVSENGK
jgi:hypothetical protein